MEMIRVLLARGEEGEALRLARAARVLSQRAAALDFIAGATCNRALLDEVIDLATNSTDLQEQATILRPALRTAADMGDRTTADLLLRRLNSIQDQLSEARRVGSHVRMVTLPKHMRTLTELAERVGRFDDPEVRDDTPVVRTGAPPLFSGSAPPSVRTTWLARALTISGWTDIVDRIVEEDPNVYGAIIDELDRLHVSGRQVLPPM